MSRFACKVEIHHGICAGRGYCGGMSLALTDMGSHRSMELGCTQSISGDHSAQSVSASQSCLNGETQSFEEIFHLLDSLEVHCLMVEDYASLCEKFTKAKNLEHARRFLLYAQNAGLEDQVVIGYNLLAMLLECGSLRDAHQLFKRMAHRSEKCWTSLIRGYNYGGQPQTALDLFQELQQDPAHTSKHAIIAALRACTKLQDLEHGRMAHTKVVEEILEMDQLVSNTLVDMYCKCRSLEDAQVVFDRLCTRDSVSWNALIGGYGEHGPALSLQQCLKNMRSDGVSPDNVTYLCILKFFERDELPLSIEGLHAGIVEMGFDGYPNIGNNLVHVYAKHGFIAEARQVLYHQTPSNEIAWTALIGGYVDKNNVEDALGCLEFMERYGVAPSEATFVCIFRACSFHKDGIARGRKFHAEVVKRALEMQVFVSNSLVDMYCKCGSLLDAQDVFHKMPTPDVISWTALLSGYVEYGLLEEALSCLHRMQAEGVAPNAVSYLCGLKACQSAEDLQELHVEIIKEEFEGNPLLGNTLVDLYVNYGLLMEAKDVFNLLPIKNVVSWNTLICGFAEQGNAEMTLHCLRNMELAEIAPTTTTFLCSLKACASGRNDFLVLELHACAVKRGFECDISLKNSLVDIYSKCGYVLEGQNVFYSSGECDVVSWNSLMGGYGDTGLCFEVLDCLERMLKEGASPNAPTFLTVLNSCKSLGLIDRGRDVHAMVMKAGFERDVFVVGALVDMYATHGKLADAEFLFEQLQVPSVVAWTALIVGYIEHGFGEKALKSYGRMQEEGVSPDDSLYVCALKVCANLGALNKGQELYGEVTKSGVLEQGQNTMCNEVTFVTLTRRMSRVDANTLNLHNVLIDMFCRCGSLSDAQKVFDMVATRDFVTWNTLITGHASLGNPESSITLFDKMKSQGVRPDAFTYASVLTMCNHDGFVERGHIYIEEMNTFYGLLPLHQHYNCIVDLLSRAGQLDVALALVEKFPFQPDLVTWTAVLGGCRKSGNAELGRHAFECCVSLFESCLPGYVLMASIYVNAQMWDYVKEIDVMRAGLQTGIG